MPVYDGVDWYWGRSMRGAVAFIDRQRPDVVILQWWTGAVLHSYLRMASHAARRGARVIVEWHETQNVGEAGLPGACQYVSALMPWLLAWSAGHVVHSEFDLAVVTSAYPLGMAPVRVIRQGPYDHLRSSPGAGGTARPVPDGGPPPDGGPTRLLYPGLVSPFEGVEDLVEAFNGLRREQAEQFRLAIVGKTSRGWAAPAEAIARSPHADLIERVDRYLTDADLSAWLARADAVVLPYHRSPASGPLPIAMSVGLPVVVTAVGGLAEATCDYPGAVLVPPRDPAALRRALLMLPRLRGRRYAAPHSWGSSVEAFTSLIDEIRGGRPVRAKSSAVASAR